MTIEVTQIANSQTFGAWLATTNRIANIISQNTVTTDSTSGGSLTTGNGFVNGHFGANFVYVNQGLVGGNVSTNSEILVLSNTKFQYASSNLVSITANTTARAVVAVVNTVSITGNVTAANTLAVTGTVALSNSLSVAGNTVLSGTANISGNVVLASTSRLIISNGAAIEANGGIGSSGDILLSNGAGVYWASATTLGVNEAGNYNWTGFHSHASNLHVGNTTVNTQISNAAIRFSNSTSVATLNLDGVRVGNTTINTVISSGVSTFAGNVHAGNSTVNTQVSNGNITLANSSTTTVVGVADIRLGNTSSNVVLSNTNSRFSGNVVFAGTANVSGNLVVTATSDLIISNGAGIEANGTFGSSGQVLASNGTGVFWTVPSALSGVNTAAEFGWSNIHNFSANLHTGGSTVNTQISNSIIRIANSTSTTTVQLADIRVGNTATNVVIANTTSSFGGNVAVTGSANVSGIIFATTNVHVGGSTVNTQIANDIVALRGSSVGARTEVTLSDIRIGNTATNVVIANTTSSFGGNVSILGVANVTGNVTVGSTGFLVGNGNFITTMNASNLSTGLVAAARLPASSTSQAGIVQLIDSFSSTSVTLAPTANAVKAVYDYAATIAATGTPPSGANQHIQFNNSGVFGGLAGFTYNSASNTVSIGEAGRLNVGNATVNTSLTTSVLTINGVQVANVGGANNAFFLNGNLPSFYTNASNLNAGTVPTTRLATSGTAGSTTFLRGDQAWAAAVTSVASGSGLTGGPITTTGTLSVLANTTNGLVANDTGVHVNSAYIATLTANNSTNLGGQPASFYTNASNLSTGTVGTARLASGTPSGTTFLRGDQQWSTAVTSVTSGSGLTGSVTTSGSLAVLPNTGIVANASGVFVNAAYIATLDANNSTNFNGQPASFYRNAGNLNDGTVATARLATSGAAGSTTFLRGDQAWSTAVTSVTSGVGLTGSITTTGSLAVLPNTGIVANATGIFVNAAYIATLDANNSTNFNGQSASFYRNADNLNAGTVAAARLSGSYTINITGTASNATNLNSQPGSFYTNAENLSTGILPTGRLSGSYTITSSNATNLNSQPGSFYTNASNLGTGTVNASRLSGSYTIDVTGTASNATNLNSQPGSFYTNATNLATGTVPVARLGSGTASATTFLAGDQSYKTAVTSVATGNGISGGTITGTGTLVATQGTGTVVNTSGIHVNASYIATIAANSATGSLTNTFTVGTGSYFVSNGFVGIGTSSPTERLHVVGNTSFVGELRISGSVGGTGEGGQAMWSNSTTTLGFVDAYTGNMFRMFQTNINNGIIQIGQLDNTGSNGAVELATGNAFISARFKTNDILLVPNVYSPNTISWASDIALKENIDTIDNALDAVNSIRGVRYNKKTGGGREIGVIAQEVEAVLPELVSHHGDYKYVAYGNFVGVLIQAIKELSAEVTSMKQEIEILKNK